MTLNEINARIQKLAPFVTLYKGEGYLYYIYDDGAKGFESLSVMIPYLKDLSARKWIDDAVEFSTKTEQMLAERSSFVAVSPFTPMSAPRDQVADAMSDHMAGVIRNLNAKRDTY